MQANKNTNKHTHTQTNYLCFGKPHRLKSDEYKEEQKKGTQYERKSPKSRKEAPIGTEKFDEWNRGPEEVRKSLRNGKRNGKV